MERLTWIGMLGAAIVAVALLAGCAPNTARGSAQAGAFRQVSATEAQELMESEEGYIILDVRTQREYDSGHIPGAICVPNETIGSSDPQELPDKDQLILVYCRSGNRSVQAARKLAKLGYSNIVEFGGINSWPGDIERSS
ncbi:MAG: rhodanese-like domain-containing protein [Collinsella sp.]|nr:rhodanese-like domain-containing protein [Collinsella sp.]